MDGYLSTKFGINLLDGFWENAFYGRRTDDGRTTDARATALALLTQSSRAKNVCACFLHFRIDRFQTVTMFRAIYINLSLSRVFILVGLSAGAAPHSLLCLGGGWIRTRRAQPVHQPLHNKSLSHSIAWHVWTAWAVLLLLIVTENKNKNFLGLWKKT